jgi:hypothetical protein
LSRSALVSMAALAGMACTPPPPPPNPLPPASVVLGDHPAIGCWKLSASTDDPPYLRSPAFVRLDTTVTGWQPGDVSLAAVAGRGIILRPGVPPMIDWGPLAPRDSIHLGWGDGFTGYSIRAKVMGDSVTGVGGTWNDAGPPGPLRRISGHRTPCT